MYVIFSLGISEGLLGIVTLQDTKYVVQILRRLVLELITSSKGYQLLKWLFVFVFCCKMIASLYLMHTVLSTLAL
jgi:hypothetical protein